MKADPEIRLLLLCLKTDPTPETSAEIKLLAEAPADWERFIRFTFRHNLTTIIYRNLKDFYPEAAPDKVMERLSVYYFNNTARNLLLWNTLLVIIEKFRENRIEAVPFKGPLLSEYLYGDYALRSFSDLDILVSAKDAVKARKIMIAEGYGPEVDLDTDQEKIYLKNEFDFKLYSKKGIIIELHWDMAARYLGSPLTLEKISGSLRQSVYNGIPMKTISDEMLLVFLCLHACKHVWESLEQVLSVAGMIRKNPDWVKVIETADRLRCRRMLLTGLSLAEILFEAPLPSPIEEMIRKDKAIPGLRKNLIKSLYEINPTKKHVNEDRFSWFHIKIRERFADKSRFLAYLAFNPSRREWMTFPLPASLSFIHVLLRPVRLLFEYYRSHK